MKLNEYIDNEVLLKDIADGYIEKKVSPCGNFFLLDYSRSATFDRHWTDATKKCRGLVVDANTEVIVGFCLSKFFNLQECIDSEEYKQTYTLPFQVYEKMDGSFINCWWNGYTGKWQCSTRGSFTSDQAIWATEWFNKKTGGKLKLDHNCMCYQQFNLIFECIYPENRIVIDYGDTEELVLLTAFIEDKEWSLEPINYLADLNGFLRPTCYDGPDKFSSIAEIVENCKTLDVNKEGYVIRFENGYRIKIKGHAYCERHKIMSGITTKAVWENIDYKTFYLDMYWLASIPEEFRDDIECYCTTLQSKMYKEYDHYTTSFLQLSFKLRTIMPSYSDKDMALYLKNLDMSSIDFSNYMLLHKGKVDNLRERIWKNLQPALEKFSSNLNSEI